MQDSIGLLALTLLVIIMFSIMVSIIIIIHQNEIQYYNIQNLDNTQAIGKAKVGYYWVVEELKNDTISFIPHVYLLDEEGVYDVKSILETTFNGNTYIFPINTLKIYTNGSLTRDGIILSPGDAIIIRPNITSGQISFITTTGNSYSLVLLPPSTKTLASGEFSSNYTVFRIGNDSILSLNSASNKLLGPKNITSVELIFNSTPPLYNYTVQPSVSKLPLVVPNYYSVHINYFENVTFIKVRDLRNNKTYLVYAGNGSWTGEVYLYYFNNSKLTSIIVGNFTITYNTTYDYYSYGPVNFVKGYIINFDSKEYGYVPLYMILYTYNVSNSSSNGYYTIGEYSQLWVKPEVSNVSVSIYYSGYNYSYFYFYTYLVNYTSNLDSTRVGGSIIYLGSLSANISVNLNGAEKIATFDILYNNSQILYELPIIMNITYNVSSYSPPFLLNLSLTNQSLPIMFNGTPNLPNYTFYVYKLPITIPTNDSIINVDSNELPYIVVYFIIEVNGKIVGENMP